MDRRTAERHSFYIVDETCPAVDAALERAGDAIKKQTMALRAALVDSIMERTELEDRIAALEREVESLKDELANREE